MVSKGIAFGGVRGRAPAFPWKAPLLLSLLLATHAHAATLRAITTLTGPSVHLADLFDDAGPGADRVLGPGPAPGGRIVVEAPQLAAIARQFGVDWRPNSPNDRAVLDRSGRMLGRDEVMAILRPALVHAGASGDAEIELPGFSPPVVAPDMRVQTAIEQLDYDATTGRFAALLSVFGDGTPMQRMRLTGTVQEMIDVPVTTHRLAAGAIIQPADIAVARIRATAARGEVARTPAQAIGLSVRHLLPPGQALPLGELVRIPDIQRGARVTMQLQSPGLALLAQGQALEAGAIGDRIQVMNPSSRAIVEAEIIAADRVRVLPGTTPVQSPNGRPVQYSNIAPPVATP